jgi:hypothetical protein
VVAVAVVTELLEVMVVQVAAVLEANLLELHQVQMQQLILAVAVAVLLKTTAQAQVERVVLGLLFFAI